MRPQRAEELWACRCIEGAIQGASARIVDDGSRPGMHDLEVIYPDGGSAAVEVTAAADRDSIEFWNLANGQGRWIEPGLAGGWSVELLPTARVKTLRKELPRLLRILEGMGATRVRIDRSIWWGTQCCFPRSPPS
jgi:hypothetical protein